MKLTLGATMLMLRYFASSPRKIVYHFILLPIYAFIMPTGNAMKVLQIEA